jgi:hypothetical protein
MDDKTYPTLQEALAAVELARFYREDVSLRPGQCWTVLDGGVCFTVVCNSDGSFTHPTLASTTRAKLF